MTSPRTFPPAPQGTPVEDILKFPDEVEISYDGVYPREIDYFDAMARQVSGGQARIMETACGFGRVALSLARRGHDVIGVESIPEMLEGYRQRALRDGLPCQLIEAGLASFPPPSPPVDIAIGPLGFINLLVDDDDIFSHYRSLAQAVRPGGLACYVAPAATNPSRVIPHAVEFEVVRGPIRTRTEYSFDKSGDSPFGDEATFLHRLTVERDGKYRLLEWRARMILYTNRLLRRICEQVPQWSLVGWHRLFDPTRLLADPLDDDVCSIFLLRREVCTGDHAR